MPTVEIKLLTETYSMECDEKEQQKLLTCALMLDGIMHDLRDKMALQTVTISAKEREWITIWAALNLAEKLIDKEAEIEKEGQLAQQSQKKIDDLAIRIATMVNKLQDRKGQEGVP